MNETSKKHKGGDKCPSTNEHDKSVLEVQKKCILNDKVPDKLQLKNGLVNGISNDLTVKKHSRKSRRNKTTLSDEVNGESFNEKEGSKLKYHSSNEEVIQEKTNHQSNNVTEESSSSKSDVNIVDNVMVKENKKKKCTVGQIVSSNDIANNQVCDNILSESRISELCLKNDLTEKGLNKIIGDSQTVSCSSLIAKEDSTQSKSRNSNNDLEAISDSFNKITLVSNNMDDRSIGMPKIDFIQYENELQMPMIMKIIQKDLSEPYSIYTYRYFIHNWPKLCFLVSNF